MIAKLNKCTNLVKIKETNSFYWSERKIMKGLASENFQDSAMIHGNLVVIENSQRLKNSDAKRSILLTKAFLKWLIKPTTQ